MMLGYITYAAAEPRQLTVEEVLRQHFGGVVVDQESEDVDVHTSTDAEE
jgi:hypothetical protein